MFTICLGVKDLVNAFSFGGSLSGRSKAISVLDYALVRVTSCSLLITSSDSESVLTHEYVLPEKVDGDYSFCLDSREFVRALKAISADCVTLSLCENVLLLSHSYGEMRFPVHSSSEFPRIRVITDSPTIRLSSIELGSLLSRASTFVSTDSLHPILSGVNITISGNEFRVSATDSHKLYTRVMTLGTVGCMGNIIIPSGVLSSLLSLLRWSTDDVTFSFSDSHCVFRGKYSELSICVVKGRYPSVLSVIPRESSVCCEVDRLTLLDVIQRSSLFSDASYLLKLSISSDAIRIDAEDYDFRRCAYEELPCESNVRDTFVVGVNGVKFLTCLSALNSDKVKLLMTSPNRAILIREPDDNETTVLLMPMSLNS